MIRYRYRALPFCFMFVIMLVQSQPSQMFSNVEGSEQLPDCTGQAVELKCFPVDGRGSCKNSAKFEDNIKERFYTVETDEKGKAKIIYCENINANANCKGAGYALSGECKR
jgi:hypothetical protein